MKSDLVLFTASFPFSAAAEQTFLPQEIPFLQSAFERVFLVPENAQGERYPVPEGVTVIQDYAGSQPGRIGFLIQGLCEPRTLLAEIASHPWLVFSPRGLARALVHLGRARYARSWLDRFARAYRLVGPRTVLYSWWYGASTDGAAAWAITEGATTITRAHGIDLFPIQNRPNYLPFRSRSIRHVDLVAPDSEGGAGYLKGEYPQSAQKVVAIRVGIEDRGLVSRRSEDGVFRILSCSFMLPIKRLSLLAEAIGILAERNAGHRIEWTHFGDGPERTVVQGICSKWPSHAQAHLPGFPGLQAIFEHYGSKPSDVFVNCSSSEGTPVSVIEAISCGIPLLVSGVGGNPELAGGGNGAVIDPTGSAEVWAEALDKMMADPQGLRRMGTASRAHWLAHYDARATYPRFIDLIKGLSKSPGMREK